MAKSVVFIGLWILGNDYIIGSILLHYLSCKGLRGGWKRCLYWDLEHFQIIWGNQGFQTVWGREKERGGRMLVAGKNSCKKGKNVVYFGQIHMYFLCFGDGTVFLI